jgi:hypothetical protein
MCAATRARISIGAGPSKASFSTGITAIACSKASAAFLLPTPIFGQREIVNEIEIIRLFFEERFQFATRLLLAFTSHCQEQSG